MHVRTAGTPPLGDFLVHFDALVVAARRGVGPPGKVLVTIKGSSR
jgi:hypothetical protein